MGRELLEIAEDAKLCDQLPEAKRLRRLLSEADEDELRLTENAQPALCFVGIALTLLLRHRHGLRPAAAAGHSLGEYTALAAGRAIGTEQVLHAVFERGRAMAEAVPAGETSMAAVLGLGAEEVERAIESIEDVYPCNYNTPTQTVIGGGLAALERAAEALKAAGAKRTVPLNVSAAFHTPYMAPAAARLRRVLERIRWQDPEIPVIANLTGAAYPPNADFPDVLEQQLKSPVRWSDCVSSLVAAGVTDFVELGPKRALGGMLKELAPAAQAHSVGTPAAVDEFAGLVQ